MTATTPLPAIEPKSREDALVWGVLAFVGALGIAIGVLAPERTLKPSAGFLILFFLAATSVSERRRLMARSPRD